MIAGLGATSRLDRLLASVLHYGTLLASSVIALGFGLGLVSHPAGAYLPSAMSGAHIVSVGIALLILLPIMRVALMAVVFVIDGDYRFGAIAALVLTIIFLGFALGLHMAAATAG